MSAGICHQQHQIPVVLVPYKEPVWSDMTLLIAFILPVKNVRIIFLRQTTLSGKDVEHISQQLLIIASLEATFERALEFAGIAKIVFHALHCLIRSSTLSAS